MSTPTNEQRADAIRERLAAATPGPWEWVVARTMQYLHGDKSGMGISMPLPENNAVRNRAFDADLIANAPADLSWLLSRIEELAKERDAANAILEELETLTGFTQTALVDEWLCVSKDAERLDWLDVPGIEHGRIAKVSAAMLDGATTVREAIDAAMSGASSSGANTP